MILLSRKIHDKIADLVMWLDYLVHLIFNPFKFKKFPKKINKILVIELLQLGDLIVITPTLRAIKNRFKRAQIDMLVNSNASELLDDNINIGNILIYKDFYNLIKVLKRNKYDLGIILHPGSFKISLALLLGKVKYRVGCTKVGLLSGKGFFLNTKIKPNLQWQHKIQDNLDVVRSIVADTDNIRLEVHSNKESRNYIENLFVKNKVKKDDLVIGIHTYSKHKNQRWYEERFADLADELIEKYKAKVVFTGAPGEEDYINSIINKMKFKPVNLVGKTSIKQFIALIERLNLLVSVDTSAIHIASALNKPVIALFGPTIPTFWGPTSDKSSVIWKTNVCSGCRLYYCKIKTHECMKSITVEDIMHSVDRIIK